MEVSNLKLIVLSNAKLLGDMVDKHLMLKRNTNESFIVPIKEVRFSNGEGKVSIGNTIRDKDVYIISDVGNYNCTYVMHGRTTYMSPDDHFQDIKRTISAMKGHSESINVVMPLLYSSRQHRRKGRESLDCAMALQELEALGVSEIITFDAHDPNIQNAIPCMPFENFYPTYSILESLVNDNKNQFNDIKNWLTISPDTGAMDRAKYVADVLGTDVGMFYKRRDFSTIVDGKNPIIAHEYMGKKINNKNAIVVDDMIASGDSIIEVSKELKDRGANKVFLVATFALLTSGIERFDKAYKEKLFDEIYTTNLTYMDESFERPWLHRVDCSEYLADIINTLNNKQSISPLLNRKENILTKQKKK